MVALLDNVARLLRPSLTVAALGSASMVGGLFAGCDSGFVAPVDTFKTAGKATFKGQPIEGATLILHRQGEPLADVPAPSARVNVDGSFATTTFASGDGAPAGEYVATVEWRKQVQVRGDWTYGPNLLPPAYADPGRSPLRITIAERDNVLPAIEIR
ncbi:MAG TPA: hypothetical protein VGN57_13465 [Pirellulaceae bacterium]|jgi:hypothetical protein|nr:hypothetical protein [Pirellulaceae bacterium]